MNNLIKIGLKYISQRAETKSTEESLILLALMERLMNEADGIKSSACTNVTFLLFFLSICTSTRAGLRKWSDLLSAVSMGETKRLSNEPELFEQMRQRGNSFKDDYYELLKRASAG